MQVIWGIENVTKACRGAVVLLGFFDGVHKGHQALIEKASSLACAASAPVFLYTFDRHPLQIVDPPRAPLLLTPTEEKIELVKQFPVDFFLVGEFNRHLADVEPLDFLKRIIVDKFSPAHVVVGYNYRYGKGHQGNVQTLLTDAPDLGFPVTVVDAVMGDGEVISSSRIRRLLSEGKVSQAARLLGRPYTLTGSVVRGEGRGKTLGVPTANLALPDRKLLPRLGIYAAVVRVEKKVYGGVVSVGKRPTFGGRDVVVEVYLLDFEGDLYGKRMAVELAEWVREEETFPSAEVLLQRMQEDIRTGRALLEKHWENKERVNGG